MIVYDTDALFERLSRSKFRSGFALSSKEQQYLRDRGTDVVLTHARTFVELRLAPAIPQNDGKQTPMRGHPAFVAQHATATCCRRCLAKWHGIPLASPLTREQIDRVVAIIGEWLQRQECGERTRTLFDVAAGSGSFPRQTDREELI